MTPAAFAYARPRSLAEALALLRPGAKLLAGGQSLMPLLVRRACRPDLVIDLNGVAGLAGIECDATHVRMGALVRMEAARRHPLVRAELAVLAAALSHVANPAIRQRGTIVGNLVVNAPGAELPCVAAALGAELLIRLPAGRAARRAVGAPVPDDAMVTHVLWPRQGGPGGFSEISRRDGHGVLVSAAVSRAASGWRAAVGGVCAGAVACPRAAALLDATGLPRLEDVAAALRRDLADRPRHADQNAGSNYRGAMGPEMLWRAMRDLRVLE